MQRGHINGERYCGDYITRKVHDLGNEQAACKISELLSSGDDIPFESLEIAIQTGYRHCEYCLNDK